MNPVNVSSLDLFDLVNTDSVESSNSLDLLLGRDNLFEDSLSVGRGVVFEDRLSVGREVGYEKTISFHDM